MTIVFSCKGLPPGEGPEVQVSIVSAMDFFARLGQQLIPGSWEPAKLGLARQDLDHVLAEIDEALATRSRRQLPAPARQKLEAAKSRFELVQAVVRVGIERQCAVHWG